jgi:hypothetical protein
MNKVELLSNLDSAILEHLCFELEQGNYEGLDSEEIMDDLKEHSNEIIDRIMPINYSELTELFESLIFASVWEYLNEAFWQTAPKLIEQLLTEKVA